MEQWYSSLRRKVQGKVCFYMFFKDGSFYFSNSQCYILDVYCLEFMVTGSGNVLGIVVDFKFIVLVCG